MQVTPVPSAYQQWLRHPADPDAVRSSKAGAVFALGLVAAITGVLVGGIIPATLALLLSRQARRQAYTSRGYLTGAAWLRRGERLAWTGLLLAAAVLTLAAVLGIFGWATGPVGQDFAPGVN
ncbi:hypothetical protein [Micromonospora sp. NBC_01813]|uniref:hypothetical protein n=1 Tax=Micromonospora sp. NBC_01813 TaxID=2975988 RepID=UPI002DD86AB1|nr:hypothetical protein [Micromonospora sp. NBC_01813]WSA08178.1 hypothetical protein OG958_28905 [Micromonospora sp. NBC_01813]